MAIKKPTWKRLRKARVPLIFIPGVILAWYVWSGGIADFSDWYKVKTVFPKSAVVEEIIDGDTFDLYSGLRIRMYAIDAPGINDEKGVEAKEGLEKLIDEKQIWLEYDRQEDRGGRILAWIWIDCEETPKFENFLYMHLSGNRSRDGLDENPKGCKNGKLVNEEMVKMDLAETVKYSKRGPVKYEERILK